MHPSRFISRRSTSRQTHANHLNSLVSVIHAICIMIRHRSCRCGRGEICWGVFLMRCILLNTLLGEAEAEDWPSMAMRSTATASQRCSQWNENRAESRIVSQHPQKRSISAVFKTKRRWGNEAPLCLVGIFCHYQGPRGTREGLDHLFVDNLDLSNLRDLYDQVRC